MAVMRKLDRHQAVDARPLRLAEAEVTPADNGGGRLCVPLRPPRWARWVFRFPEGATKSFELDALGMLVWEACDGKTSVLQIVRRLEKRYHLTSREAEVSAVAFLQTLMKKGLIGMAPREQPKRR
jgi:hypothetical protein